MCTLYTKVDLKLNLVRFLSSCYSMLTIHLLKLLSETSLIDSF